MGDNVIQLPLPLEDTTGGAPAEFEAKLVISYEHIVNALEYYLKTMNPLALWSQRSPH